MKRIHSIIAISACLAFVAFTPALTCKPSQQAVTYNSLAATEDSTSKAYTAYMQLVLQGQLPTNNVPAIAGYFRDYQAVESVAVSLASGNTAAIASPDVTAASVKVINAVNAEKAKAGVK